MGGRNPEARFYTFAVQKRKEYRVLLKRFNNFHSFRGIKHKEFIRHPAVERDALKFNQIYHFTAAFMQFYFYRAAIPLPLSTGEFLHIGMKCFWGLNQAHKNISYRPPLYLPGKLCSLFSPKLPILHNQTQRNVCSVRYVLLYLQHIFRPALLLDDISTGVFRQ